MELLWREFRRAWLGFERLFFFVPSPVERPGAEPQPRSAPQPSPNRAWDRAPTGGVPDWMRPSPSTTPRRALPLEVVSALMALGLASPPPKDELKRIVRRALADAHPDRHPGGEHAAMAMRLAEVQKSREVLRRHNLM